MRTPGALGRAMLVCACVVATVASALCAEAVRGSSARAPAICLLLLLASWRSVGHDAAVDPLSLLTLRLCASRGPSGCCFS